MSVKGNEARSARTWLLGFIPYIDPVNWMRKHDHSLMSNAAALVICGLLAGVVVAAAAFPAIAVTGLAAKAGADDFDNLPSALQTQTTPQVTDVYASDGKTLIAAIYDENRRDVSLDQISPHMLDAIVASEDTRFFDHNGVDARGVIRAFLNNNSDDANQQGASTLTMQYVRLQTLYSATTPQEVVDATADTAARKLREMHEAIAVEQQLTKVYNGDVKKMKYEILRRYLNIAPFGENTYGIYAASKIYFNETPDQLTVPQAALLAGVVQSTSADDPHLHPDAAKTRRNQHVLPAMLKDGAITAAEETAALAAPIDLNYTPPQDGCTQTLQKSWGFFCDYLERWWDTQEAFGTGPSTRENQLETGGYRIVTSLNVKDQAAADASIATNFKKSDPDSMMLAGVEPGTGRVQIMAVNRNFSNVTKGNGPMKDPAKRKAGDTKGNYPNTTLPLLGGDTTTTGYQFGSTFKMFTMIAALSDGIPLSYKINTQNPYKSNYAVDPGDPTACGGAYYCPHNSSPSEKGEYTMWNAFGTSVNTFFVPLEDRMSEQDGEDAGPLKASTVASKLGLTYPKGQPDYDAFTLGVTPAFPLDMASAYAAVSAEGKYCVPTPIVSITDFNGNKLDVGQPQCTQAIDPGVADAAIDAAHCPVGNQSQVGRNCTTSPTAVNTLSYGMRGRPWAGKSGTTDHNISDSFIGMTPQLAIAGLYGDTDWGQDTKNLSLQHKFVNEAVARTMAAAVKGLPKTNWNKPPESLTYGTSVGVPSMKCSSVGSAAAQLRSRGLRYVVQKNAVGSGCGAGTVASSDPSGSAPKGSIVALYVSNGKSPTPPPVTNPGGPGGGGGGGPTPPGPPACIPPGPCQPNNN
jgi:membrane peptidoglycan carboxypeptidase